MKMYPFSAQRHAHDIELRRNVLCNEIGDGKLSGKELTRAENLHIKLTELLLAISDTSDGWTAWLSGPQIGLAKETVVWASEYRTSREK